MTSIFSFGSDKGSEGEIKAVPQEGIYVDPQSFNPDTGMYTCSLTFHLRGPDGSQEEVKMYALIAGKELSNIHGRDLSQLSPWEKGQVKFALKRVLEAAYTVQSYALNELAKMGDASPTQKKEALNRIFSKSSFYRFHKRGWIAPTGALEVLGRGTYRDLTLGAMQSSDTYAIGRSSHNLRSIARRVHDWMLTTKDFAVFTDGLDESLEGTADALLMAKKAFAIKNIITSERDSKAVRDLAELVELTKSHVDAKPSLYGALSKEIDALSEQIADFFKSHKSYSEEDSKQFIEDFKEILKREIEKSSYEKIRIERPINLVYDAIDEAQDGSATSLEREADFPSKIINEFAKKVEVCQDEPHTETEASLALQELHLWAKRAISHAREAHRRTGTNASLNTFEAKAAADKAKKAFYNVAELKDPETNSPLFKYSELYPFSIDEKRAKEKIEGIFAKFLV